MLVISRKADEGILIGDGIKITISEITKDKVKIGIIAPPDVKIIREELHNTKEFNISAASIRLSADLVSRIVSGTPEITERSDSNG